MTRRPTLTVLAGGRAGEEEWWWKALREIGRQLLADSASPISGPDVPHGEGITSPVGDGLLSSWPLAGPVPPIRAGRRPQLYLVPTKDAAQTT